MKIIKSLKCPKCHKLSRFENCLESSSTGSIFWKIIATFIWLCIPIIGWIMALLVFISIFTKKKGEGDLYCSNCGHKITLKKDFFGRYKEIQ